MKRSLASTIVVFALVLTLMQVTGCRYFAGTHRKFSRSASKQHFFQHQAAFQSLVTTWMSTHATDDLVYRPWNKNELRWDDVSVLEDGSGYLVQKGAHRGVRSGSFDDAAHLAGANPVDLARWLSSFRTLEVAFINVVGTEEPTSAQYVRIGLQEAGADYGYLYVPVGNDEARTLLVAGQRQPSLT